MAGNIADLKFSASYKPSKLIYILMNLANQMVYVKLHVYADRLVPKNNHPVESENTNI
jgi:hypothetical protein